MYTYVRTYVHRFNLLHSPCQNFAQYDSYIHYALHLQIHFADITKLLSNYTVQCHGKGTRIIILQIFPTPNNSFTQDQYGSLIHQIDPYQYACP